MTNDPLSRLQRALADADGHSLLSPESQALVTELRDSLRRDEAAEALIDDLCDYDTHADGEWAA